MSIHTCNRVEFSHWLLLCSVKRKLSELWELLMDREAWSAAIHGVAKSRTRLSDWTELNWRGSWMQYHAVPVDGTIFHIIVYMGSPLSFLCRRVGPDWATELNWILSTLEFLCCCSVAKLCLWDPMDSSTPGFSILHYLLEFAQTLVLWVSDVI